MFAPRRYGKSSLVWRVSQLAIARDVLVAHVNLMTTPTSERLAEKLAETIHDDLASTLFRARERLRVFAGLRITPVVTVDPNTGKLGFTFDAGRQPQDLDATLERLLELPGQLAAERGRKVALVLDEFQEIVDIDPDLPRLMRSVFETQPDVAHVYLGSKRHMLERIFNDENEPFWRSAKQMELGVIAPPLFRGYIDARFESTGRRSNLRSSIACSMPRSAIPMRPRALLLPVGRDARGRARDERPVRRRSREAPARRARPLRPRLGEGRARAATRAPCARARARTSARQRVPPPPRAARPVERPAGPRRSREGRARRAGRQWRVQDRRAVSGRVATAGGAVGSLPSTSRHTRKSVALFMSS